MSRVGKMPIEIEKGVEVNMFPDNKVVVKGPLGSLERVFDKRMKITISDFKIKIERKGDNKEEMALHGLTRALLNNMVIGVHRGFQKVLQVVGTGYKVNLQGKNLVLNIGFSHPVIIEPKEGITFSVLPVNKIVVKGIDKQKVGEQAAEIRMIRKPEPYKGKGIRYENEWVRKKAGKTGVV